MRWQEIIKEKVVPNSVFVCRLVCVCRKQIDAKRDQLSDAKRELKSAKADAKVRRDEKTKKYVQRDFVLGARNL